MLSFLFLKGWLIGFSIAMPVGPIGLICIRNSLARGMTYGLTTGLGAAVADTLFAVIGGFCASAIGMFLLEYQKFLQVFGALFLCYLGISIFRDRSARKQQSLSNAGYLQAFISTFLLTLMNPLTILSFVGIYTGLGLSHFSEDLASPLITTCGIFVGSAIWWLLLSAGASLFKHKMTERATQWLNRISGALIFGFGIVALSVGLFY